MPIKRISESTHQLDPYEYQKLQQELYPDLQQYSKILNLQQTIQLIQKSGNRNLYDQNSIDYFVFNNMEKLNKLDNYLLLKELLLSQPFQRSKQQVLFIAHNFKQHEFFKEYYLDFNDQNSDLFKNMILINIPENEVVYHVGDSVKEIHILLKGSTYHLMPDYSQNFEIFTQGQQSETRNKYFQFKNKFLQEIEENQKRVQEIHLLLNNIDHNFNLDFNNLTKNFSHSMLTETLIQICYILINFKTMKLIGSYKKIDSYSKQEVVSEISIRNKTIVSQTNLEIAVVPVQIFQKTITQKIQAMNSTIFQILKSCQGFKQLPELLILQIIKFSSIQSYLQQAFVCQQNDKIQNLYFVQSGEIEAILDGKIQVYYKTNTVFGEEVIKGDKAQLGYKCSQNAKLVLFNWKKFLIDDIVPQQDKDKIQKVIQFCYDQKYKIKPNGSVIYSQKKYITAGLTPKIKSQKLLKQTQKLQNSTKNLVKYQHQYKQTSLMHQTYLNKLNQKNGTPQLDMLNIQNYYVMKTKYFSPPNFVIYQHQPINDNYFLNESLDKQIKIQQQQLQNNLNNTFDSKKEIINKRQIIFKKGQFAQIVNKFNRIL